MSQFGWPITQKKRNYGGSPKVEGSILKYRVPPLWPTYIGERRTTCAHGIKVRCYWELFREHDGKWMFHWPSGKWTVDTPLSTPNTTWKKKSPPHPQEKREDPSLHDATSHWLNGNSTPKFVWHYFWPGLIALPKNTLPIQVRVWKTQQQLESLNVMEYTQLATRRAPKCI
jgi:hypothetical protein